MTGIEIYSQDCVLLLVDCLEVVDVTDFLASFLL